ncbi:hypothetical protein DVK44_18445 [Streptomyces paludis]|uniref:Uncharacterized protein n=1 Tax=Streptomyces paludis TaxID=2282738 RepID=A0A345HRI2_9ACTN|nr:hypothetical protein DVK44_18445 [Streptomyces paludis]
MTTLSTLPMPHQLVCETTALEDVALPPGGIWNLVPASVPREFDEPTPELLARVRLGLRRWVA